MDAFSYVFSPRLQIFFFHAAELRKHSSLSVGKALDFKATQLDGNSFEVTSAACVGDASQYHKGATGSAYSLAGQNGTIFIENVIFNMIMRVDLAFNSKINVQFPQDLRSFLSAATVPFIYSMDFKNNIFEKIAELPDQNIFVQSYERTSNRAEIDGKFSFKINETGMFLLANAKIECSPSVAGFLKPF